MCNSTERYGVLEEYLRLGESERAEKSRAWRAAIGLQDVDGLPTSDYLLLGRQAELKNRYPHVDYAPAASDGADSGAVDLPSFGQSANGGLSKCQNVTLEEMLVLRELQKHPEITQKELAAWLGVSERTIKRRTVELQEKGCLKRANGKRRGKWIVVAVPD